MRTRDGAVGLRRARDGKARAVERGLINPHVWLVSARDLELERE